MALPPGAFTIALAHAQAVVDVRPRPRIHLSLLFANPETLPFAARGVDLWGEPGRPLLAVGIGARLPARVSAAMRDAFEPRVLHLGSAVNTMLDIEFADTIRASGLPYEPLGVHGSPWPRGPLGGVALRFRAPGAGDGSFTLSDSGLFRLNPRLDPGIDNTRDPGVAPHPATLEAHARWVERWGEQAAIDLDRALGPTARRLLGQFRSVLQDVIPQQVTVEAAR